MVAVLVNNELGYLKKDYAFKYLPASLFIAIMINPTVAPFDDVKCRQAFSGALQKTIEAEQNDNFAFSKSIFVPIIPGYLNENEFPRRCLIFS